MLAWPCASVLQIAPGALKVEPKILPLSEESTTAARGEGSLALTMRMARAMDQRTTMKRVAEVILESLDASEKPEK